MKERPILFSAPMVRAILEGRKTQTRRLVKRVPMLGEPNSWCAAAKAQEPGWVHIVGDYRRFCPYGAPGDRLWVRETWCQHGIGDGGIAYRADKEWDENCEMIWNPSIHMPRLASRITLEIESVRVERINEISSEDCIAEGVKHYGNCWLVSGWDDGIDWQTPHGAFRELWESIHGTKSWDRGEWVWVIQFRRIQ